MAVITDRFVRQQHIVQRDNMVPVAVIGCGAIGRDVAMKLAAIGQPEIVLCDFDLVEEANVTTQLFLPDDVGHSKVLTVQAGIEEIDCDISVEARNERFKGDRDWPKVVFVCVDSIDVRKFIYEKLKGKFQLLIDARMLAETFRVLVADIRQEGSLDYYERTFFDREDAAEGRCTSEATNYCASGAAMHMVNQYTRWLRDIPVIKDRLEDLLAGVVMYDVEEDD